MSSSECSNFKSDYRPFEDYENDFYSSQFHQHFTSSFYADILWPSQTVIRQKLAAQITFVQERHT